MASQSLSQVFEHPKRIYGPLKAKSYDGQMKIMPHEGKRILQLSMGEESEQHQLPYTAPRFEMFEQEGATPY